MGGRSLHHLCGHPMSARGQIQERKCYILRVTGKYNRRLKQSVFLAGIAIHYQDLLPVRFILI